MSETELTCHYGRNNVVDEVLATLGITDGGSIEPAALAGMDEFHLGGRPATTALITDLELGPDHTVLDVGCGIGGAARTMAATVGCRVSGIDLTPAFIDLAGRLSEATGLADLLDFRVGSALALPFDPATFDAVTMLHVGMNIADKDALMAELARVVRPSGTVAVYDVMRIGDGRLSYPVPWSPDETNSHLAEPDRYRSAMERAGLTGAAIVDRRPLVLDVLERAAAAGPPSVHLGHLMGDDWPTMFGNLRAALQAGVVAPTQITAERAR